MPPYDGASYYKIALGLSRLGIFPLLSDLQDFLRKAKTIGLLSAPTRPQVHLVEDGSPKGGMWTSPANETAYKFCKGDIRPRGQWPKY